MGAGVLRRAREADRFEVTALARRFHSSSGVPFEFDAAHASMTVAAYISTPRHLCLVNEVDGALRGVLAAQASISPLAPVLIAQELVFWIDPEWRGDAARKMIAAYEKWAASEGCVFAGLSGLNDPLVARFFRRAGFDQAENKFLKKVG